MSCAQDDMAKIPPRSGPPASEPANKPASKPACKSTRKKAVHIIKGSAAAAMVTISSFSLYKAVAATGTLSIMARIVRAIEITINTSLNFGTIGAPEDLAATATLDPYSGAVRIDTAGGVSIATGYPTAGQLRIRGSSHPVQVSFAHDQMQLTNGTAVMTVDNFNFNIDGGGTQATVTPTGINNSALLSVGARLNTRPQQVTGTYIGSNTIFANYQ